MTTKSLKEVDVKDLMKKILADPSLLDAIEEEDLSLLRKGINPYQIVGATESFINISIINWRDLYLRKLHMTSMVAFLFRIARDYRHADCEDPELKDEVIKERAIINKFLKSQFEYDPSRHTKSSHSGAPNDPDKANKDEILRSAMKTAEKGDERSGEIKAKRKEYMDYVKSSMKSIQQSTTEILGALDKVLASDYIKNDVDAHTICVKKYAEIADHNKKYREILDPVNKQDTFAAYKSNLPSDVFHNYNRYFENNFEDLREACHLLYAEKPDIEFSIIYYDHFQTAKEARAHKIQHQQEFKTHIETIDNTGVNILGPFVENVKRLDIYNKNTEVISQMMEQAEEDMKVGANIMGNAVKNKKVENIKKSGPDSEGLEAYKDAAGIKSGPTVNQIQQSDIDLAAAEYLKNKKKQADAALEKATLEKAALEKTAVVKPSETKTAEEKERDLEPPPGAVRTDVFLTTLDESGMPTMAKNTFFTKETNLKK